MKRIAILAVVAAVAVTGCNKKVAPEPVADVVVEDARPVGRVTDVEEPVKAELTDAEVDSILGAAPETTSADAADTVRADVSAIKPVAPADTTAVAPVAPAGTTHVVRKGDTLWSLAARHLGSGRRWREIVDANPGIRPERLVIGQTLRIPAR